MGPPGTGKTHSIGTLVETGLEVFYFSLEAGMESLLGYWKDRGQEVPANLHWHQMAPPKASLTELGDIALRVNTSSYESLTKMSDPNRMKYNQFVEVYRVLNDFPDQRTGQKFGAVDSWGTGRALVIDPLTGLNEAIMSLVVGGKPAKSPGDYGVAQDQLQKFIRLLTTNCRCHFILIAHVSREVDEILGGSKITVATPGKALAPILPAMFSDVIMTVRQGASFTWDTASALADVKSRNLPIAANNLPSFGPIIAKWKARGGVFEGQ